MREPQEIIRVQGRKLMRVNKTPNFEALIEPSSLSDRPRAKPWRIHGIAN